MILVTGVNGFVGHHVAVGLNDLDIRITGIGSQSSLQSDLDGIVKNYISCDLTNPDEVKKIDLSDFDAIINLAGFAKVGDSKGQGELYNRVNVGVHSVLYEECLNQGVSPRIIAISTGAVYDPNQQLPITEESEVIDDETTNEYVISKKLMEQAVASFNERGLNCIIARPFNHSGPGQLPGFLLPDLGGQIVEAVASNKPLKVGNLSTKRDYTDVRDVARAYVDLATCDSDILRHDIYNICSGKSISGEDILEYLKVSFNSPDLQIEIDQSRIRQNEVMDIFGSHDRLTQDTGWNPEISVVQMVKDYADWKNSN